MRFVYLDEAGISAKEPITVVAGVIIHGDRDFVPLEARIRELIETYVPPTKRFRFAFHAKELVHGGATFPREDTRRYEVLQELAKIPYQQQLPIVIGFARRRAAPMGPDLSAEKKAVWMQCAAFSACAIAAERYVRASADHNEIASCVAEDTSSARKAIKAVHEILSDQMVCSVNLPSMMANHLPITRLIDTVHFATKYEARILCLADICAYIAKRYLTKAKNAVELYNLMTNNAGPTIEDLDHDLGYYLLEPSGPCQADAGKNLSSP